MNLTRLSALLFAVALSLPGQALETMQARDLQAWCSSDEASKVTKCRSYITGFLDGAFATDPRVAQNILEELEQRESFSQRAARTRIGASQKRFGPSYYAGFCVPPEAPVEDIQAKLIDKSASAEDANARDFLYAILQKHYPCETK
jgi:hypothetical protein